MTNPILTAVLQNLKSCNGPTCPAYLERQKSAKPRCTTGGDEWNSGWCRRTFGDLFDTGTRVSCPCIRVSRKAAVIERLEEVMK